MRWWWATLDAGLEAERGQHALALVRLTRLAATGLTRTRVFCVFHDMAHHSFFSNKFMNQAGVIPRPRVAFPHSISWFRTEAGALTRDAPQATLLGWIVYTPYTGWKKGHDYHHRHSNNTERKQFAQTAPLTAQQFLQLTPLQRLGYKLVYGQWSLVSITPTFYFIVYQVRLPGCSPPNPSPAPPDPAQRGADCASARRLAQRLISAWYENLMVAAYWTWLYSYGGSRFMAVDVVTMVRGPGALCAARCGVPALEAPHADARAALPGS